MKLPGFPPDIEKHFPPITLSVCKFLEVNLPPAAVVTTQALRTQKYHSDLPPTSESVDKITLLLSPPDDILATLQQSIRSGTVRSIQCPHSTSQIGDKQRYPLWIVSFWVQLASVRKRQENWRRAVENLKMQMERNRNSSLLQKLSIHLHTFRGLASSKEFVTPLKYINSSCILPKTGLPMTTNSSCSAC